MITIFLPLDLPIAYYPSGNIQRVIVGDFLNISVVILANEVVDPDTITFSSVEGNDQNNPMIELLDEQQYQIVYTRVGVPPTTSHQLCFAYEGSESPRIGLEYGSGSESGSESGSGSERRIICTDAFNLVVTGI